VRPRRARRFLLALAALLVPALAAGQYEVRVEPGALPALEQRILAMDRQDATAALARAGLPPPARVHITLIADTDPRAGAVPRWTVAQALGTETVVIFPDRIASYPYGSLEAVVLHEIAHLALNLRAGGRPLPRWFHEGVAVSVESGWGVASQMRLLITAWREPGIDDVSRLFRSGSQPDTETAYLLAAALVEDVRERHGEAVPGAIAARVAGGMPFEAAFAAETGVSVESAAAEAWATYRTWQRWLPVVAGPNSVWGWILVLAFLAFAVRMRKRRERRRRWDEEGEDG
jgi:hypothetical protein